MDTPRNTVEKIMRGGSPERVAVMDRPWSDTLQQWLGQGYPTDDEGKPVDPTAHFSFDTAGSGELEQRVEQPSAYFIEYNDGFQATLLMLNGAVQGFTFAGRIRGLSQVQSTQFLLPGHPNVVYSACLMEKAEEMFVSGRAPYPIERTLLVGGMLERCLESRLKDHCRLTTPELDVSYQASEVSHFCGAL